jgi:hypothetical protein
VELPPALALVEARELLGARAQLDALAAAPARRCRHPQAAPAGRQPDDHLLGPGAGTPGSRPRRCTLARRLGRLPGLQEALSAGRISIDAATRIGAALTKLGPLVDRFDGLIDGQPGEQVVTAVLLDGVLSACGQALGGLDDEDVRVREPGR